VYGERKRGGGWNVTGGEYSHDKAGPRPTREHIISAKEAAEHAGDEQIAAYGEHTSKLVNKNYI